MLPGTSAKCWYVTHFIFLQFIWRGINIVKGALYRHTVSQISNYFKYLKSEVEVSKHLRTYQFRNVSRFFFRLEISMFLIHFWNKIAHFCSFRWEKCNQISKELIKMFSGKDNFFCFYFLAFSIGSLLIIFMTQ